MPIHDGAKRRKVLRLSAGAAGAAALATLVPFVGQVLIHRKTTENGEIVEVDLSPLPPGQVLTVDWLGQPVLIARRTPEMISRLDAQSPAERLALADPDSEHSKQPAYARNAWRSLKAEFFVAIALCPHLGCTPTPRLQPGKTEGMPEQWAGGFLCPCHTSTFDLAGRAHKDREAKQNLGVPPYRFVGEQVLRLGEDPVAD